MQERTMELNIEGGDKVIFYLPLGIVTITMADKSCAAL